MMNENQHKNHIHICEIKELDKLYGFKKKEIKMDCPNKVNYKNMSHEDCWDECMHFRTIYLTDDGNHITEIF